LASWRRDDGASLSELRPLERSGLVRLIVLAVFAVVAATGSVAAAWVSSGWQAEVNHYWESQTGNVDENDPAEQAIEKLSNLSYQVSTSVGPLVIAALVAAFVILAVLGQRWARQHPLRP
jgi:ABC-type Fe3+ transport system permease subunit